MADLSKAAKLLGVSESVVEQTVRRRQGVPLHLQGENDHELLRSAPLKAQKRLIGRADHTLPSHRPLPKSTPPKARKLLVGSDDYEYQTQALQAEHDFVDYKDYSEFRDKYPLRRRSSTATETLELLKLEIQRISRQEGFLAGLVTAFLAILVMYVLSSYLKSSLAL